MMKSKILFAYVSALITLSAAFCGSTSYAAGKTDATSTTSQETILSAKKEYKFSDLKGLTIETERLVLTPTIDKDLDKLAEYLLDKDVTKYLDSSMSEDGFKDKNEALDFLKGEGSSEYSNSLEFTIKLKDSDVPIGKIDLMLYDKSKISLGYWIGKDFQRKGYMFEAGFKLCNIAFNASDIESLDVYCHTENVPSLKLVFKIFSRIQELNKSTKSVISSYVNHCEGVFKGQTISFDFRYGVLSKNI